MKSYNPDKNSINEYNLFLRTHSSEHLDLIRLPKNSIDLYDNNNYFFECSDLIKSEVLTIRKENLDDAKSKIPTTR